MTDTVLELLLYLIPLSNIIRSLSPHDLVSSEYWRSHYQRTFLLAIIGATFFDAATVAGEMSIQKCPCRAPISQDMRPTLGVFRLVLLATLVALSCAVLVCH